MPVTGTRHNSHNPSSELTASPFAFQKPPNFVFSPETEQNNHPLRPQALSVGNDQNVGVAVIIIFIQVPKQLIPVWTRMITDMSV